MLCGVTVLILLWSGLVLFFARSAMAYISLKRVLHVLLIVGIRVVWVYCTFLSLARPGYISAL